MDECIDHATKGRAELVLLVLYMPGWEGCACTGVSRVIKRKNGPHKIFTEFNSSQAPCKVSRLSIVLWE